MRGLAEYAMKGRRQAILAVFITGLIPLANTVLSPALVALVILRFGMQEGFKILPWAVLPALGWMIVGDFTHLVVLLGVSGLAAILQRTASWQMTLLGAVLVGVGAELILLLNPQFVALLKQQAQVLMGDAGQATVADAQIRALFGVMTLGLSVLLLVLARWWQASLYNPGGFGAEFRRLRLDYRIAFGLVLMALLANFGGAVLQGWTVYLMMPVLIAGLALVHGIVALKQLPGALLVVFYVLLMLPMAMQLLTMAALIDSWYNFRDRIS